MARRQTAIRLFLTGWVVYCAHFAPNVVREVYLAVALGEHSSVRVDEYLGLHPDLFEIPERGAYINSSPGASMLGAVPYAVARPALDLLFRLRPELGAEKPPSTYDDPRPNRTTFMNEARARGLDIKLGLAAAVMQIGLMAPASACAMVLMYWLLCVRLGRESHAKWLALLYGFGTPVFFRTAFLNQNLLLAHFVLAAFAVLICPSTSESAKTDRRDFAAGTFLGFGLLCDYSAAPLIMAFSVWILATRWASGGAAGSLRAGVIFGAGILGPVALLLAYQWVAFGVPWFPAQHYMPPTPYSAVGWSGMTIPTLELLWNNMASGSYGLLTFCPMLIAAVGAPFFRTRAGGATGSELALIFGCTAALWLFNSANQFSHLQFNTGVRYMVPAVPLLFLALVPVLLQAPRIVAWVLVLPTVTISWSVSMAREDVATSLGRVFLLGPELPWLTALRRMASGYAPFLAEGASPLVILAVLGAVVWFIWWGGDPRVPLDAANTPPTS